MLIQVLGTGCPKCAELFTLVQHAVTELNIQTMEVRVEKVTDIQKILAFEVLMTPALVIDGTVVAAGRLPTVHEIKGWMSSVYIRAIL